MCKLNNFFYLISYDDYFDKLLRFIHSDNVKLFSRQDNSCHHNLDIVYRKLYRNIVLIIVLNIEARQYNIKISLAISCSPIRNDKVCILFLEII